MYISRDKGSSWEEIWVVLWQDEPENSDKTDVYWVNKFGESYIERYKVEEFKKTHGWLPEPGTKEEVEINFIRKT